MRRHHQLLISNKAANLNATTLLKSPKLKKNEPKLAY